MARLVQIDDHAMELSKAVVDGGVQTVKDLISDGADVDARGFLGLPPMFHAAVAGKHEILKVLVDSGADRSVRCNVRIAARHALRGRRGC